MNKFTVFGNTYRAFNEIDFVIVDKLPAKTFSISWDDDRNQYFLRVVEDMVVPSKIYGKTQEHVARVIKTFEERTTTTGIMLSGNKGSGKTLFTKLISEQLRVTENIPTIIINEPHCGEDFNKFIQSIEQPVIIVFDEFEKVYDKKQQKTLLTILDGTYTSKKLFILTCNNMWEVDEHMINRPGRLFYNFKYDGISIEFIKEYSSDNLKSSLHYHIPKLQNLANIILDFNFDMLKAIVEELNRFEDTDLKTVLEIMNIEIISREARWAVVVTKNSKPVKIQYSTIHWVDVMDGDEFSINITDDKTIDLAQEHITSVSNYNNTIILEKDGYVIQLDKKISNRNQMIDKLF